MMQSELEELIGKRLAPWQWQMAEYVYMNHPDIHDVGGKGQIANIILAQGFEYPSQIRSMYKEVKGPPIIVETKRTLCETYDVSHEGYCINTRGNKLYDIYKEVGDRLKKEYPELMANADYFNYDSPDQYQEEKTVLWDIGVRWIIVHYVTGGSEGYYVHVATLNKEGKYYIHFLGKTLLEGEAGISWGEKMVAAISRIMQV
jgi:hypothetical protein